MIFPNNSKQDTSILHTGTTTIGIKCVDGIVLATDHRAVAGYYVAHKHTRKIYRLADHIASTIAGVVADCQKLVDSMNLRRSFPACTPLRLNIIVLSLPLTASTSPCS